MFALALPVRFETHFDVGGPIAAATLKGEETMSKLAISLTAAIICAGSMVSSRAEAMTVLALMRAATDAIDPLEKVACGWYPSGYPQSWAVYTPGWGCRYVYSPYYYDPYVYRPYYGISYPPGRYRSRPYWPPRMWWSWY
jgi:hypothetical protein